jgi:hypothetical protein
MDIFKMVMVMKKLKRLFELYLGWIFVNGRKQEQWRNYLRKKYKK